MDSAIPRASRGRDDRARGRSASQTCRAMLMARSSWNGIRLVSYRSRQNPICGSGRMTAVLQFPLSFVALRVGTLIVTGFACDTGGQANPVSRRRSVSARSLPLAPSVRHWASQ